MRFKEPLESSEGSLELGMADVCFTCGGKIAGRE
jgi:hypothetical protein